MQSSSVSTRQFVDDTTLPEDSSGTESRCYQSATSLHEPLVSSQLYFQQLVRMLGADALHEVELGQSNKFEIYSGSQLATSAHPAMAWPSFNAAPDARQDSAGADPARAHLTKLFAAGWELDSGAVVPFASAANIDCTNQPEPPVTARQLDLKPVRERQRLTQSWVEWDKQDPRYHVFNGESFAVPESDQPSWRDESAWFAAGACTDNTVALLRPRKNHRTDVNRTSFKPSIKDIVQPGHALHLHPENRFSSRRADAHMRLRQVQVIDQSSLQQVLQDAREREVERIAARAQEPKRSPGVKTFKPWAFVRQALADARTQVEVRLKKLRMYFS